MKEGVLLAGPAREVPLAAKLRFLFGGFYSQFGWAWLGFSSIHVRLFLLGNSPFEWAMLFILLFPAVGLTFIGVGLRKGLRGLRLLTRGIPARGRLTRQQATNTAINDRPVMAMTFEFQTVDGRGAKCVAHTHETERLEDGVTEELVYDPEDPSVACLLDDLPGRPSLGDDGVVRVREGGFPSHLLLPAGTGLMHLLWTLASLRG